MTGPVTRSINPHISADTLVSANRSVRQLARLFNIDDPHSRRALFKWACDFVGAPEDLTEPIHVQLRLRATKDMRRRRKGGAQ